MNPLKKLALKLGWRRAVNKMPSLKTWAPVIGGAGLVVIAALHAFGQHEAAAALMGIIGAIGLGEGSPVTAGEATEFVGAVLGAGALTYGIVRKFLAKVHEIRAGQGSVAPFKR